MNALTFSGAFTAIPLSSREKRAHMTLKAFTETANQINLQNRRYSIGGSLQATVYEQEGKMYGGFSTTEASNDALVAERLMDVKGRNSADAVTFRYSPEAQALQQEVRGQKHWSILSRETGMAEQSSAVIDAATRLAQLG